MQELLSQHTRKLAAIIYFDDYNPPLLTMEEDAGQICDLLEGSFNYQIISNDPNQDVGHVKIKSESGNNLDKI